MCSLLFTLNGLNNGPCNSNFYMNRSVINVMLCYVKYNIVFYLGKKCFKILDHLNILALILLTSLVFNVGVFLANGWLVSLISSGQKVFPTNCFVFYLLSL